MKFQYPQRMAGELSKKILMVEDDPDIRGAVQASLESRGYTVIPATDYLKKPFDIEKILRFIHRYV